MLKSTRDIPLILQEIPKRPTLTVENYVKWYDTYIVHPDGRVTSGYEFYEKYIKLFRGTYKGDHCFNPDFIRTLDDDDIVAVDYVSFDVIVGRWEQCYHDRTYNEDGLTLLEES
jgi:hypothetical protein